MGSTIRQASEQHFLQNFDGPCIPFRKLSRGNQQHKDQQVNKLVRAQHNAANTSKKPFSDAYSEKWGSSSSPKPSAIQNTPCRPYEEDPQTKNVVNTLQQKLDMAVAPRSTRHLHLDPSDLRLRLTSRSSYSRKYRSAADPTFDPKEKGEKHVTRSGSCYRRDPSVEDNIDSSLAQAAKAETPRRSIHRKNTPKFRTEERDPWKMVLKDHRPERSPPREEIGYPLSEAIEKAKLPPNFQMRQCDLYDGTRDPGEHVYQFETNMLLIQVSDAVMCRAFPTTLRKAAHAWFKSLQPRSVHSFAQLSDLFQKHFVSSCSQRKNLASLLNVVQEKNESLACFLGRFNAATLKIDNLDESVKYTAFLRDLQSTSKFAFSVNKSPPGNMKALLEKANKYIQAEEYLETHRGR
ncbi:hypothetical protein RJ639_042093 [Escallonia herrerae]|uniref:Retrotransposon gag domain-containing protein n=1 Tax=Escallonia herrerae TaxID=1293975 RepID=A0AA88WIL4_9ASTE|nr:hypothetical protein RJ639_042093 [Escallonia herrerae]